MGVVEHSLSNHYSQHVNGNLLATRAACLPAGRGDWRPGRRGCEFHNYHAKPAGKTQEKTGRRISKKERAD